MKFHDQQAEVNSLQGYSKREILELKEHMQKSYDDQLKRITEMVLFWFTIRCILLQHSLIFFARSS